MIREQHPDVGLAGDFTRVVVENLVLGTHEEHVSPFNRDETLKDHGAVRLALDWYEDYDPWSKPKFRELIPQPPIGVSVSARGNVITIRWHQCGDDATRAQAAMLAVLDGSYTLDGFTEDAEEEGGPL